MTQTIFPISGSISESSGPTVAQSEDNFSADTPDVKPSLLAGGKVFVPPPVNLEVQIPKFIGAVQLASATRHQH